MKAKENKKAISLIVLIITIIVMIILASAIILSLDNANIFNKAEEAVDKTNAKTNRYLSELKLAERELEKIQGASKVTDTNPGTLSGQGTAEEPYLIESIEDLVAFSEAVNNGTTYEGKTVKLTRLLDFNSDNSYANPQSGLREQMTTGKGFTPIGSLSVVSGEYEYSAFKGTFDGDGTEIRNLYINNKEDNLYIGLFDVIVDAEIKNLGVTGNITSTAEAGVGGIVGYIDLDNKNTYISNCYSKVNITARTGGCGGIVGEFITDTSKKEALIIQDTYYAGTLNTQNGYVGGIIGLSEGNNIINRCYNKGTLNSKGDWNIGGILGAGLLTIIMNSYNEGIIIAEEYREDFGGIASWIDGEIYNSYNAGEIRASTSTSKRVCGGIIGDDANATKIENVYNIGRVSEKYEIGDITKDFCKNIYYITGRLTPAQGKNWEGILIGKTFAEMKSQAFVEELNTNIGEHTDWASWKLGPKGYPVLDI